MKWKLEIEMKLLEKMELELKQNFFRMKITLPLTCYVGLLLRSRTRWYSGPCRCVSDCSVAGRGTITWCKPVIKLIQVTSVKVLPCLRLKPSLKHPSLCRLVNTNLFNWHPPQWLLWHNNTTLLLYYWTVSQKCNYYTVSQKMCKLWNGIAQNYKNRFWWHLAEIFRIL